MSPSGPRAGSTWSTPVKGSNLEPTQLAVAWDVDVETLERFCNGARSRSSREAEELKRFIEAEPNLEPLPWAIEDLPSTVDQQLPAKTNPKFWRQCVKGLQDLRERIYPSPSGELEHAVADDIGTAWLRREVLGGWLRSLKLRKTDRVHVVHCYLENYLRLHNAVMYLSFLQATRALPKVIAWAKDPVGKFPIDREKEQLDWVFEFSCQPISAATVSIGT